MLVDKLKKLNEMAANNMDNLTDPAVIAISQEVDIYIVKEMRKRAEANRRKDK